MMLRSVTRTPFAAAPRPWRNPRRPVDCVQRVLADDPLLLACAAFSKNQNKKRFVHCQPVAAAAAFSTSASRPQPPLTPTPQRYDDAPKKPLDWRKAIADFERLVHVHGNDAKLTAADVFSIVTACAAHGRHREAQSVMHRARVLGITPTPATQAQMCALQARKGAIEPAFEQIQSLLKTTASANDTRLFDPLVSVLKEQHDWQNIRRTIQLMHDFQLEPPLRVFRALIIAASKSRQKDMVLKTAAFLQAKFPTPAASMDIATLTAICQALTEVGETRKVMDLYHEMDQEWLAANGNTILFNNFVLAALRHGRLKKAIEIFERMKISEVCPPDDFTFATCILEFEKREDWDQVIRFFNEMQDREMKGISHQHAINALSCAAVVRALHSREGVSKRTVERDMQVLLQRLDRVELKQFGHSASLVDVLIDHQYRSHAQTLFNRMAKTGVIMPTWLRQNGYEVDLHSFSRGMATCAVVHAFQQIRRRSPVQKVDDMRIITGVGKRSKEFLQPVVPAEVSQLLVRSFRPLIRPMQHPTNPGALLIRSKTIQEWLTQGAVIRNFE